MHSLLEKFERIIVLTLMFFMMIAVMLATIDVGFILWQKLKDPPFLILSIKEMMEVFGFILMVIIGLELLETIKAYLKKHVIHVEVVLLVAVVAVARKVIILDYKEIDAPMLFAISSLIISLTAGYYIVRRALCPVMGKRLPRCDRNRAEVVADRGTSRRSEIDHTQS